MIGIHIAITLPLTLAIIDGLIVKVGEERFILPTLSVCESFRPKAEMISRIQGRAEVVNVRGRVLPIVRLHEVLAVTPRVTDPTQSLLVIVENGRNQVALLVDELVGQHQVVIKSLEANYRKVPGTSGATIMGDGSVAMILDVTAVTRMGLANTNPRRLAA